jgi:hypothetical protein
MCEVLSNAARFNISNFITLHLTQRKPDELAKALKYYLYHFIFINVREFSLYFHAALE